MASAIHPEEQTLTKTLFHRALKVLSFREHSEPELRKKLMNTLEKMQKNPKQEMPAIAAQKNCIDQVITQLTTENLLNDQRFAGNLIASQRKKGRSRWWIREKLSSKGLAHSTIDAALKDEADAEIDSSASSPGNAGERIELKAARRYTQRRRLHNDAKGIAALQRQGFRTHIAIMALDASY